MRATLTCLTCFLLLIVTSCAGRPAGSAPSRVITVSQSGNADVTGTDNEALQKAVGLLRPGDTLSIGPGSYTMNNSLFVPSGVTVRGVPGQTILRKSSGVESALTQDGGYGETALSIAEPERFRRGMGIAVLAARV